jgi:REP element-mobilizing transposase RayT
MPYVKVWIHLVWTTKHRKPLLDDSIRARVLEHIRQNAKAKGIFIDHIDGYHEHVHVLISLGTDQKIAEVVKLLKGESSHWINQEQLVEGNFQWQHEYFAVGVSESIVDKVRAYIRKQEKHHSRHSFEDEFDSMIIKFGFRRHADDDE